MHSQLLPGEGEATRNQLNTINGCYVPCLLNILGAILYLRIGFSVGMMGMLGTLGIFFVSQGIAYLTIGSFSAIVTNGRMKGGGAYYMISRNLGPAFGGSRCVLRSFLPLLLGSLRRRLLRRRKDRRMSKPHMRMGWEEG
jgi:amino acid transporter